MTKQFSVFSLHSQREKTAKGNQASETDASDPDTSENTTISTDQPTESQSGARNDEIEILISHFGQTKTSAIRGKTADPVIDAENKKERMGACKTTCD